MSCRHCRSEHRLDFVDLGSAPPSNAYLTATDLSRPEKWFPLRVFVCTNCWLVQTEDFAASDELFTGDYAYFSSTSRTWLDHARVYAQAMTERFDLKSQSFVVEVASNDGYLLQFFQERGIPNLGVEPTASTARAARDKGLAVEELFFGRETARDVVARFGRADLTAANNVLAHVPDINDFAAGFAELLKPTGVATFEFPHLLNLIGGRQFDTIYHEHYSYLSLYAVERIFGANGLRVFDVDTIATHGGSLRIYAQLKGGGGRPETDRLRALRDQENAAQVAALALYEGFQKGVEAIKDDLLRFLIEAKRSGQRCGAYGAAAKGNTLLNFAGVRPDLLPWVIDRAPSKQGRFMPGSRIPIVSEERLRTERPDYILILPWNLREEVEQQLSYVREWGARFVTAVPELRVS